MFLLDVPRDLYMELRREMWNFSSFCLLDLLMFYVGFVCIFVGFIFVSFWGFCFVLFFMHVMFLWESQDTQWVWRGAWHCPYPRAGWGNRGCSASYGSCDRMCNRSVFFHFLKFFCFLCRTIWNLHSSYLCICQPSSGALLSLFWRFLSSTVTFVVPLEFVNMQC